MNSRMCFFKMGGTSFVVRGLHSSFGGRQRVFHDGGFVINIGKAKLPCFSAGDNILF